MQKRSLNTIYKQLAKTFHPDLEPDNEKKKQKEELMKKLTVAYEKSDLYMLLSLELEWMNNSGGIAKSHSDEQLKIYNLILKDQVEELQRDIHFIWDFPKYYPLQRFYNESFAGLSTLKMRDFTLQRANNNLHQFMELLRGPEAERTIKEAIQMKANEND